VGSFQTVVVVRCKVDAAAENLFCFVHARRIIRGNVSARCQKVFNNRNGRCIAHIVRRRLEGESPHAESFVTNIVLEMRANPVDESYRLSSIYLVNGLENLHIVFVLATSVNKGTNILRETTSAETQAREQEGRPDAGIRGHAFPDHLNVGADRFTKSRDLVHKGNARGKKSVGGIFQHFGRANVHDENWTTGSNEGSIKVTQDFGCSHVIRPDNNSIGFHEIVNGGALLQELRVRQQIKGVLRFFLDDLAQS